jgi:crossover junction endodeoxyribonuclease RuvC
MAAMIALGLDPGSRVTGFGVVSLEGGRFRALGAGVFQLSADSLAERLALLHRSLAALLETHRPDATAVEGVLVHRGARSALILGHARGVVLLASAQVEVPVFEYAPATVKRSLTSAGGSSKAGVARAVAQLLGIHEAMRADASDALAVAVCHLARHRIAAAGAGEPSPWTRALMGAPPQVRTAQNRLLEAALRRR